MKTPYFLRISGLAALLSAGLVSVAFSTVPDLTLLARRLAEFYRATQPEVSFLHLDQDAYMAGETLWFKAYLLDARAHQPDSLSKVLYVDIVGPDRQVLFKRTLALTEGLATGDIILPDTLQSGVYTVRAYTNWMRNSDEGLFFTRRVSVWQASAPVSTGTEPSRRTARSLQETIKPDVQFFPEGGDYVAGISTTIGVKAVAASGLGVPLSGIVVNGNKQEVARFTTPARGMSSFGFTPQAGQQYEAHVTLPNGTTASYPLPAVRASGWILNVREVGDDFRVFVRYQAAVGNAGAGTTLAPRTLQLLAHVRGQTVYAGQGQISSGQTFQATIAKSSAPAGLLHITLFDEQQAQAERLVFVPESRPLNVSLRPQKTRYGSRELVSLDVEVSTADGHPAPAELSLAVVNADGLPSAQLGDATNVRAHLLLTSELRGYVQDPAYYLEPSTPAIKRALDDLLLTQGWSRFTWQHVMVGPKALPGSHVFPLERALSLSGRLIDNYGKPVPNGELTLLLGTQKELVLSKADINGNFLFTNLRGLDSTQMLLQARTAKGGKNVMMQLNEWWPGPSPTSWHSPSPLSSEVTASAPMVAYSQRSLRQQQLERIYHPYSTSGIILGNVDITGRRTAQAPLSLHRGMADAILRTSDIPTAQSYRNVFDLLQGRMAGVQVTSHGGNYSVRIRGVGSLSDGAKPLLLINSGKVGNADGTLATSDTKEVRSPSNGQPLYLLNDSQVYDSNAFLGIMATEIDRVEVLKGANAGIYGIRGANGVIAVYTKRGLIDTSVNQPSLPAAGVAVRQLPAYHRAREFYAPRYETSRRAATPDPRATTLYWQPRLTVPASGRARVSFYTADQAGTFRASVEGVSLAGQPATAEATLTVAGQP